MLPYEVGERSANICSESNIVRPNHILYSTSSLFHSCALLSTSLTSSLSLLFHTYAELSISLVISFQDRKGCWEGRVAREHWERWVACEVDQVDGEELLD